MWRLLRWIGLAAVLLFVLRSRTSGTKTVNEISEDEQIGSRELLAFIEAVSSANDESDSGYRQAVDDLKSSKDMVLRESERILSNREEASFGLRHATLLALGAMEDEAALDLLERVALNPQPLPPRDGPDFPDAEGPEAERRVQQDMLSLAALDGIAALARGGSKPALDRLGRAAARGTRAVRSLAIATLGSRPEWREEFARAKADLPRDMRDLAAARFISIEDVPQVRDPRRHLIQAEQGGPAAPEIDAAGRPDDARSRREPVGNAPRVSGEAYHG
jgi:hypothetical protein